MKKLFTIDDLIIALVSAVGYGFSFEIPKFLGYEEWLCTIICLVVGMSLEALQYKIIFSKFIQKKPAHRSMAFAVLVIIFLFAVHIATEYIEMPLLDYILGQYAYVILPPLAIFAFNIVLRRYRIKKIRNRYGDGSNGFLLDDMLTKIDIDKENRQNRQIHGSFDTKLAVKTKTGVFIGDKEKDTIFFIGIPYAKPPVGELRWKAPEPLPESDNVFEAENLGASAVQVEYEGSFLKHHRQSEDCLTLNIVVGSKKTARKKPVLVIFHHGDFSYGGSADPLLSGYNFIKSYPDTIGVSFNYRLGIFGFINFSEIPGGEAYPDSLNLGLLDQIAALKWIKENIAAFGGDPEQITIMGFEAGAISASLLAVSAQAKGLFQKVFTFYGCSMEAFETPEVSINLAKKLLKETSTTTMEELMRLSTERLKEAQQKLETNLFAPTCDGKLIPLDICAAYKDGAAADIEFIIGIPSNERYVYKSFVGNKKYEIFISEEIDYIFNYLDAAYPAGAKAVRDYIAEQAATIPELEVKSKLYEQFNAVITYLCAQKLSEGGNKVRILYWDVKPLIENLGSGTVDVVTTFLGNRDIAQMYGNVLNQDIAKTLQTLFRKFLSGDELKLFNNEIKGIGAIDWKEFPNALIVSDKSFKCEPIKDKLTEIKTLLKILAE